VSNGVTFTIDVEDHWADPAGELRYEQLTWEVLAWLERADFGKDPIGDVRNAT